ncbi:MAG: glycine cleavage T C-terminal barrel domain-containing protein [Ignavibacteriaceae bacterium]
MPEMDVVTSPIIELLESLNYNTEIINGKKVVKEFSSTQDELNSLCYGAGLRDISYKGIIELRGKDVLDFLHRIATNSTRELGKEKLIHTIFTNEKGRIIDLAVLFNFDDYQLLICNPEYEGKVKHWIDKYTITDDVKATEVNGKYALLELSGPQADSFIMLLAGSAVTNIQPDSFKIVNSEGMLFFLAKITGKNGVTKYWIIADPENGRNIVRYMNENKGPYDFNLVGESAYEIYRVEQGIPETPGELNDQVNPHEVKLLNYIDFKKGCYIGQEVIARLETYEKVQKYLMGIKFEGDPGAEINFTLFDEENKEAGKVTSIVYSEKFKMHIALAFVRKLYAEDGRKLTAKGENGAVIPVTVSNLPFKK